MRAPRRPAAPPDSVAHASGLARVRRLQLAQTVMLVVIALVVVAVGTLSGRALVSATEKQRASNELLRSIVVLRDDARVTEVEYWRQRALEGRGVKSSTVLRIIAIVDTALGLQRRQLRDPADSQSASAASRVIAVAGRIRSDASAYLGDTDPASRNAREDRVLAHVAEVQASLSDWVRARVNAANAASTDVERTVHLLITRAIVLMGLVVGVGLLLWWALGRTRTRVLAHVQAAAREQTALRRVAELVAEDDAGEAIMSELAGEVVRLIGGDGGWVIQVDGARGEVVGAAVPNQVMRAGIPASPAVVVEPGTATALAVAQRAPVRVAGYQDLPGLLAGAVAAGGGAVGIAAPIIVSGAVWGALVAVASDPGALPAGSEDRLVPFARLAGLALSNARALRKLAARASTDPLTGLPNHGVFHERLGEEVVRAARHDMPLALAVLDLDHFKEINDTHGHPAGDRVLAEVAERLTTQVRDGEMLARIGGEEFAWLLPATDVDGAFRAAERARDAVGASPLCGIPHMSVSVGVCELADAGSAGELFRLADAALLMAKAEGRNMTVRYHPGLLDVVNDDQRLHRAERARTLAALRALARAVDARDSATQRHSERVADRTFRLALELGWDDVRARALREAALVHDVGKIGVPDAVLRKPGALTPAEFEQIAMHAPLGATIVSEVLSAEQAAWVRHHHERVDGCGYPDALQGHAIPEGARVLAVADAWDAMTQDRPYREALSPQEAAMECTRVAGTQLDAEVVAAMLRLLARSGESLPPPAPDTEGGPAVATRAA